MEQKSSAVIKPPSFLLRDRGGIPPRFKLVPGGPSSMYCPSACWKWDLKPERLEVSISYRPPEAVGNGLAAGAYFVAIHNALGALLVRRWSLPKNGRRPRPRLEVKP